jgi:mRNA interferase MazF
MERFVKGEVVVVLFPFSDLSEAKKRPALVLADLMGNDIILCQITSKNTDDIYSIHLSQTDFAKGSLNKESNIRPNRIFTADKKIIAKKIGKLKPEKYDIVAETISRLIRL